MMAFDQQEDWDYVEHVKDIFRPYGTDFYHVELVASKEVRLARNASENRLKHKVSKRNVEWSNQRLIADDQKYRCQSLPGEIPWDNYLRIENEHISAAEAAQMIKEYFDL